MAIIRTFQNSDLPGVFEVWMRHWQAAKQTPAVSVSILERAIMSRQFFDPESLMVGIADEQVIAWGQWFIDTETIDGEDVRVANIAALCFADDPGLAICDQLLQAIEEKLRADDVKLIRVGPVRDDKNGYAGLAPIGYGIGVPVSDARTGSLLSRNGYHVERSIERLVVNTSTYRPPVNRAFLQFRRSTRLDHLPVLPQKDRTIKAMSHFDIERHILTDHQQQEPLAVCGLWMGDPEVQVMESSRAILALRLIPVTDFYGEPIRSDANTDDASELTDQKQYLIASLIQSLSNRQIFTVETAVDQSESKLIEQLKQLKFECVEHGRQWVKNF
ncbi:hypothetical protein SAMN06265222_11355 [Neorhodopirellula lusitana]|uniref:N-acetyltransferase domain-containing protein n=1 Tax=Neorhodopirellula lusitana TaxID=445327 RepID=A0ABY1QGA0_9BACT|nr:hypothetical protein [Neorhodopirellula lusitana]SMP70473.1 hypothetical protein SAMN06265222_11355 [Neorhodopirellula lusitana]